MDEDALGRGADLAGVAEAAGADLRGGHVDIGVGEDDRRAVAAHLEEQRLAGAAAGDDGAGGRRAGEADGVGAGVGDGRVAPYTATKGAVRNLTRGMATDWARHGLQVNALAPGYFETPLNQALVDDPAFTEWLAKRTPAGRWGRVDELVGAAVFLASDASSFVNGHTLYVDGGVTASL